MPTLGSLFDGAGTFPFAAEICGITSVWASEIEHFPIRVTSKNFPNMKHLGDINGINGAELTPVDVITLGSPCQDLSRAKGQREGLDGEKSGLFNEAIRIIKEMRDKTNGRYPRFAIWENVTGAFTSNDGDDFKEVLSAFCRIKDGRAYVPRSPYGRWFESGLIVGEGYSVSWRVLNAQFWGVSQRRRRVFLVADFRGESAAEILFKRQGLSRSFAESRKRWHGDSKSFAHCASGTGKTMMCYVKGSRPHNISQAQVWKEGYVANCLNAHDRTNAYANELVVISDEDGYRIRRLTPTEWGRLQGMPDWWCDGIRHSDDKELIMWGNGMALPCVLYIMEGISEVLIAGHEGIIEKGNRQLSFLNYTEE